MPAQVSHIIAAEEALLRVAPSLGESWGLMEAWDGRPRESGEDLGSWFRLGAQGPDVFYHNQRTKPSGLHYGVLAHRRNFGLAVEAMLRFLLEAEEEARGIETAWLLGFATHAAVDRAIHPFIVHFSGWQSPLQPESARFRSCHPFLERLLDIDILERLRGRGIGSCDLEALMPLETGLRREEGEDPSVEGRLARLLARGLRAGFPKAAGADFLLERRVRNALEDARYFFRVTNPAETSAGNGRLLPWFDDHSGWRSMALIYPERLPEGLDVTNEGHGEWEHPAGDGRASRSSHAELFELAVAEAARALETVNETLASRRIPPGLATLLGNGGLSVTDDDGIPVPPRVSRPLPLKEVMEGEFERRILAEKGLAAD